MRVFNRIVVALLLLGLLALGFFTVLYGLDARLGAQSFLLSELPIGAGADAAAVYVENIEDGILIPVDYLILIGVALLGLVLLILELKPRRPRRVRVRDGVYATRRAVEDETTEIVEQQPEVLRPSVKVKAQRRPGAKINVRADVRAGENAQAVRSELSDRVQRRLSEAGLPVGNLKVRLTESATDGTGPR